MVKGAFRRMVFFWALQRAVFHCRSKLLKGNSHLQQHERYANVDKDDNTNSKAQGDDIEDLVGGAELK